MNDLIMDNFDRIARMINAIANPTSIAILNLLRKNEELNVTDIYKILNINQPNASHHLGMLRDRSILISRRNGKMIFYSLKDENIKQLVECLNKI